MSTVANWRSELREISAVVKCYQNRARSLRHAIKEAEAAIETQNAQSDPAHDLKSDRSQDESGSNKDVG